MRFRSHTYLTPHLSEDQLIESYLRGAKGAHLDACRQCLGRYDSLARAFEQIRDEAVGEADAVFTGARLHEQRDRILRRLERLGHSAEVVMFPNRAGGQQAADRLLGPARRWVAGAAAAGLVAGLFLGFLVDRRVGSNSTGHLAPSAVSAVAWPRVSAEPALMKDEQILTEIEEALTGPHHLIEMRVLDDMTTPRELQREASFVPR